MRRYSTLERLACEPLGPPVEAWLCDSCQEVTVTNELVSPPAHWTPTASDPYRWAECPNCGCDTLYPFNFYRAERRRVVTHA